MCPLFLPYIGHRNLRSFYWILLYLKRKSLYSCSALQPKGFTELAPKKNSLHWHLEGQERWWSFSWVEEEQSHAHRVWTNRRRLSSYLSRRLIGRRPAPRTKASLFCKFALPHIPGVGKRAVPAVCPVCATARADEAGEQQRISQHTSNRSPSEASIPDASDAHISIARPPMQETHRFLLASCFMHIF